jgi:hypothetical protein
MFKVQQFISFIFSGMNHATGPMKLNILEILTIFLYIVVLTKTAKVQKKNSKLKGNDLHDPRLFSSHYHMQLLKNFIFFKGGSVGVFEKVVAQNEHNIPFPNIEIKYHKLTCMLIWPLLPCFYLNVHLSACKYFLE